MADCELLATCIFFNDRMAGMPSTAEIFKLRYCRGDSATCARYMVYRKLGRENVPANLFPNETHKAEELLGTH